ncbi:MAG TPA: hypothetical protein VD995_17595 [Azospirillum sp.]|nr:hypothetical protein [Azospirillum sp.]
MTVTAVASGFAATHQTARKQQPGGPAFADFLGETATRPAAQGVAAGIRPSRPALPGGALDPAGLAAPSVMSAEQLRIETAAFTEDLNNRFTAAHVDTRTPVTLDIAGDGSIVVRGDHPDKAKIERLFAEDPALANRYRAVSQGHALKAHAQVAQRYAIDLEEADDDEERKAVHRRIEALTKRMEAVSGQMTLSGGALSSSAVQMATDFTRTPEWLMG